jgi:hypothetical protein
MGNTTFQCLNCRLAQRAEVRAVSLPSPRAGGLGYNKANTMVAMLLALKHCPRCGHYDRNIAQHNRHTVRVAIIAYALVLAAIGGTLFAIPKVPLLAAIGAVTVLAAGFTVLVLRLRYRHPANVESRVTLLGSTPMNQNWF